MEWWNIADVESEIPSHSWISFFFLVARSFFRARADKIYNNYHVAIRNDLPVTCFLRVLSGRFGCRTMINYTSDARIILDRLKAQFKAMLLIPNKLIKSSNLPHSFKLTAFKSYKPHVHVALIQEASWCRARWVRKRTRNGKLVLNFCKFPFQISYRNQAPLLLALLLSFENKNLIHDSDLVDAAFLLPARSLVH